MWKNKPFYVNLSFPLLTANCIPHNRIYKDKNAEGSLSLGIWSQSHVVLQTHLRSHFIFLIIPQKQRHDPFSQQWELVPLPFSSESKVL